MLPLSMIVAIGNDGAIGYKGKIPWNISEDMSYFKKITQGHAIIMGRKTWNEIGKPLQGRRNIVISKENKFAHKDVEVFSSIEDAISSARTTDLEPIIIGGSSIYTQTMPLVTKIYLTEVNLTVIADTFFIWNRNDWKEIFRQKGNNNKEIEFVVLVRNDKHNIFI